MTKLKRNMIELVKNPEEVFKGAEVEIEKYWTPPFIPLKVTYEATDLMGKLEKMEKDADSSVTEILDLLVDFTANKAYGGLFSTEDLHNRLHAPDAISTLQNQVLFIAQGLQSDETKKFLAKKR